MSAPTELVASVAAAGAVALLMPLPRPSPAPVRTGPVRRRAAGGPGRPPRAAVRGHGGRGARRGVLRRRLGRPRCRDGGGRAVLVGDRADGADLGPPPPGAARGVGAARRGPDGRLPRGRALAAAAVEQITAAVDAPLSEELAAVSARLRLGVDPATVWRDLAGHPQLGGLGGGPSPARWTAGRPSPRRCCGWPTTCAAGAARRSRAGPAQWGSRRRCRSGSACCRRSSWSGWCRWSPARCRCWCSGERGPVPLHSDRRGPPSPGPTTALEAGSGATTVDATTTAAHRPGGPRRRSP